MDFTSREGRVMMRQIQFQLILAKRRRHPVDVARLALRIARKHRIETPLTRELVNDIAVLASRAQLPVYFSRLH